MMNQILIKVRNVDSNNSDAVKDALSGFFQNLPKFPSIQWLRELEDVINRFPKYCMTHRTTIENHLIPFLDSDHYYSVIEAAKCGHALQQVRPSHEKTATPKTCWREQLNLLCNTAHLLIGAIFTNAIDVYKSASYFQKKEPDSISATTQMSKALAELDTVSSKALHNAESKQALQCMRLRNVLVFIQAMLVEIYPVAKPIRPQIVLDVLVSALTLTSGTKSNYGTVNEDDITMLKTQALRTLDALVLCLGPNLLPFSPLVFRLTMQTLRWSSERPSDESRQVRIQAYSSLSNWLTTLHCHKPDEGRRDERGKCWEDELVTSVIEDITPDQHVVQLTVSAQSMTNKKLSKKAKRKLTSNMLQESNMAAQMPGEKNKLSRSEEMNDELAVAALECAENFLTVCGIFLKPSTHKILQERLVRECFRLNSRGGARTLRLCRTLDALRASTPSTVPPPTQYCLQLYSQMINCADRQVSTFCSQALLNIRLHLHCSPQSLNFALAAPPETETETGNRRVSRRNRDVLESLLGSDRLPSNSEAEVVTVPDEPSPKRVRLEEVAETESISSQSSVEISDDSSIIECFVDEKGSGTEHASTENNLSTIQEEEGNSPNDQVDAATNIIKPQKMSIHEAVTQLPANASNEDGQESQHSIEVVYDFPNTADNKVTVLEKLDDENLPSTNETDDIQITCGQVLNTQEPPKRSGDAESTIKDSSLKINGDLEPGKLTNGDVDNDVESVVTVKIATTNELSVEDMLADFVDEVIEITE